MRYQALACDYDGTLVTHGQGIAPATLDALARLRAAGCRLLIVTGRELEALRADCDHFDSFDLIVAENGALMYDPASDERTLLAAPPPPAFVEAVRALTDGQYGVGGSIVATRREHAQGVKRIIRELGLNLQVIYNKEWLMVLPAGVDKASGLAAALRQLGVPPEAAAGIGDAENDYPFLSLCGLTVAVANAVPELKARADLVTQGEAGAGVVELAERLL